MISKVVMVLLLVALIATVVMSQQVPKKCSNIGEFVSLIWNNINQRGKTLISIIISITVSHNRHVLQATQLLGIRKEMCHIISCGNSRENRVLYLPFFKYKQWFFSTHNPCIIEFSNKYVKKKKKKWSIFFSVINVTPFPESYVLCLCKT